jgi:anti-anti-sigma factor
LTTPAEIAVERKGGVVVARVGGEVDMSSIPNDALGLVVDLGDCRYLDSAAIEVLFDLARRLARRRQDLRLAVPPSSPLRRVLILTEISSAAPMHDGLDEAVTAVG